MPAVSDASSNPAQAARRLLRRLDRATLATALPGTEGPWPYASLVLAAGDIDASPLLLLSDLAEHAKNLARDARASLLFDGTAGEADPLAGARVTVLGRLAPEPSPGRLARYLRRHPAAAAYAGFRDFRLYRMAVTRAHLVAGFGRINWIDAAALLAPGGAESPLAAQEPELLEQINEDQGAMLDRCATALLGRAGEGWRLTGIDVDGADLRRGGEIARLDFLTPVGDREAARQAFAALAQSALRGQPSH